MKPLEISGINLDPGALREAFRDHGLLLIRQPGLSAEDQIRFARVFGEVQIRGRYSVQPDNALVQHVSNARADGILGDGEIDFHQDHLFYEQPLKALILYGIEIPPSGSVTKFRSAAAVYERLPTALRARAERVKCLHLYNYSGDYTRRQSAEGAPPDSPRAWQPLVWTQPESGRRALWINRLTTVAFDGVTSQEGEALLEELTTFADAIEDCTYAHTWRPGDLVLWDNRMLHHARMPFNAAEKRTLRRTPIV
jgi:alpha-ketoglutarate-dependent taurine dioxygenase